MNRKKTELKTKPEMKRASQSDLKTRPTNVPKSSSAARETHTESSREPTIPMIPQLYQKLGDYVFEGDMSNTVTELMTGTNQPPPIEIDYSIHQTGSSSRLNKFRKMYPSTTYQIPRLTKTIGPARLISSDVQIQETGVCGFGRSGYCGRTHGTTSWISLIKVSPWKRANNLTSTEVRFYKLWKRCLTKPG